jgi:hypothetical protein
MSGLDPIPHLRIAQKPPSSKFGCPVCKTCFAAKDGYIFLTHWYAEKRLRRARQAGYLCFDKLTCILCFVNDEESGHC